jgi:1-acyl-sn-glycerol-3-phosphate acyltransferase
MTHRLVRLLLKLFFRLFIRLEVNGLENLPASGGYIAASNHLGRLDVALVYHLLDRDDVYLLVAEKYRKYAIFRFLAQHMDAVFVERFAADFSALREMLNRLKRGGVLVIAPEGTRSPTGALIEGKPGGIYLAAKAGVPILPVAATGTQDRAVIASFKRLSKPQIRLRVGQPFTLPPVKGAEREAALQKYTEEVMCRIGAMLPPEYRGVYAEHPRLLELLELFKEQQKSTTDNPR